MNKPIIFLCTLIISVLFSCTKNEDKEEIKPTACLVIEDDNIKAGQSIVISNCSENAVAYTFFLDNEEISLEDLENRIFNESGIYSLKLEAIDGNNNISVISQNITVQSIENSFYFPEYMNQEDYFAMAFDINPINGKMYFIDGNNYTRKFTYKEINENLEITSTLNFGEETNYSYWPSAFILFFQDGGSRIQVPHVTATSIHRQEYTISTEGTSIASVLYSSEFDLNYLKLNDNLFSVGGKYMRNENDKYVYHAAVNSLDSSGNVIETYSFSIEGRDALIGNMISTSDGYMAYGGVFDVLRGDEYKFANYKSKLFFFDSQFALQSIIDLKDIEEESFTSSAPSFVTSYHIKSISNNNLVLYGPDGIYIIDSYGEKLASIPITNYRPNSILVRDNYFIISEYEYLKKYDFQGNMIAEVKHEGISTLGLLDYKENILFMSYKQINYGEGANATAARQIYFGLVDEDLNIINF